MTSYTGLNHKFSILLYFNIKVSIYGILTCCLNYICDVYYNYLSIITIFLLIVMKHGLNYMYTLYLLTMMLVMQL